MKLLFDQNLSRKLVTRLADLFPNASHVQFHGLADASDSEIWEFTKSQGFVSLLKMPILLREAAFMVRHRKSSGCDVEMQRQVKWNLYSVLELKQFES